MRSVWMLTAALLAGAALAQNGNVCAPPTAATTPTMTTTDISTATTTVTIPGPCAALMATNMTNDPMILVLGTEENYALNSLRARNLGWYDAPSNYNSFFDEGNPLTHSSPNGVIVRHGNPYYPYYQLNRNVRVIGVRGTMVATTTTTTTGCPVWPRNLTTNQRNTLTTVYNTYATLTPDQATKMGYVAEGVCTAGLGTVYVNRNLIDTTFDAQHPEAFSFTQDGRVAAVHYIMVTDNDRSIKAFGTRTYSSPVAPGGQQVTVWMFQQNAKGLFAPTNTAIQCAK